MKVRDKLLGELVNTIKDILIREQENAGTAIAKLRQRLTDLEKLTDFNDSDTYMHLNAIIDDLNSFRWYWESVMDRVGTMRNCAHLMRDNHAPRYECHGEARVKEELALRDKYHGIPQPVQATGATSSMAEAQPRPPFRA